MKTSNKKVNYINMLLNHLLFSMATSETNFIDNTMILFDLIREMNQHDDHLAENAKHISYLAHLDDIEYLKTRIT